MILLIDNYDSFTYNIYQMIGENHPDIIVMRNDEITFESLEYLKPDHIVFSPGPGYPANAGLMPSIIQFYHRKIPMLGICLGHQAIAEAFGAKIIEADTPVHGKQSIINKTKESKLFDSIDNQIKVGRYHSLTVDEKTIPECLSITAKSNDDELIMGLEHKEYPIYGLQFHPESILTEHGQIMLNNFLQKK